MDHLIFCILSSFFCVCCFVSAVGVLVGKSPELMEQCTSSSLLAVLTPNKEVYSFTFLFFSVVKMFKRIYENLPLIAMKLLLHEICFCSEWKTYFFSSILVSKNIIMEI